jgi:hypothetical protein
LRRFQLFAVLLLVNPASQRYCRNKVPQAMEKQPQTSSPYLAPINITHGFWNANHTTALLSIAYWPIRGITEVRQAPKAGCSSQAFRRIHSRRELYLESPQDDSHLDARHLSRCPWRCGPRAQRRGGPRSISWTAEGYLGLLETSLRPRG